MGNLQKAEKQVTAAGGSGVRTARRRGLGVCRGGLLNGLYSRTCTHDVCAWRT